MDTPAYWATKLRSGQQSLPQWLKNICTVALVLCVCGISVAIYFRYQIQNGFTVLNGDRYDQVIAISIFEHWRNTFLGISHWSETGYFFPTKGTLGYNDGYFLYGAIYSVFRGFGIDPYLSGELVNVATRTIGFFGFYVMSRRVFFFSTAWALLGATLFTISNNIFIQAEHTQMLSVSLAPVMAVLIHGWVVSISRRRPKAVVLWGLAGSALYAVWLMTSFYMAWFFVFFGTFVFIAYLVIGGRGVIGPIAAAVREQVLAIGAVGAAFLLFNIPFLSLYLPKAFETGIHSFTEVSNFTLAPLDIVRVGDRNLLYSPIMGWLDNTLPPGVIGLPGFASGFPFILLFCFGCGAVWLWRSRKTLSAEKILLYAVAIAAIVTWILALHVGDATLWWFVYHLFPGAKAPRVVVSYEFFLTVPVIVVALAYLSHNRLRITMPILGLICVLLAVEELNMAPFLLLSHGQEVQRLASVPRPPATCKSFFVTHERPQGLWPGIDASYSHNVDAMIIAESIRIPTINGMSTFTPPGWNLRDPEAPDYMNRVKSWVALHPVPGLCRLDLRSLTWTTQPFV